MLQQLPLLLPLLLLLPPPQLWQQPQHCQQLTAQHGDSTCVAVAAIITKSKSAELIACWCHR
jgi:hypothetical protein